MSKHLAKLIRKLSNAELVASLETFAHSDDQQMVGFLIAEAKRRGM